ncbi:MAG: hypothetical protein ACKVS6_04050 [Planctomycetota bacterium]
MGGNDDHGKDAEDAIENACLEALLPDYVVRAPKYKKEGAGPVEVADILIPFRNTLFVIQAKSRRLPPKLAEVTARELKELEDRIDKAVVQVGTIRETLSKQVLSQVKTSNGIWIPFDSTQFTRVVGIVILDINCTDEQEKIKKDISLLAGFTQRESIPIHIFMKKDFQLLVAELDTPADLERYLAIREKLLTEGKLVRLFSEKDLLATVICRNDIVETTLAEPKAMLILEDGLWEAINADKSGEFALRNQRRRNSKVFDEIIIRMHTAIGHVPDAAKDTKLSFVTNPTVEQYRNIIETLSTLNRAQRIIVAESIIKNAQGADTVERGYRYFAFDPQDGNCAFLFLMSRQPRTERIKTLNILARAAYIKFRRRTVVAIGIPNFSAEGSSIDTMLIQNIPIPTEPEIVEAAESYFGNVSTRTEDEWGNISDVPSK